MAKRTLVASLIVWFCFLLLLALLSPSVGRASGDSNLLQNPSFEQGTAPWLSGPSGATFIITSTQVYSGTWAASLHRTEGLASEIYICQDVEGIVGYAPYTLSGWAYNDRESDWVALRIEWWDSSGKIGEIQSDKLMDKASYHHLCVPKECDGGGVPAPHNAIKARIKSVAYIHDSDPETPVFFDDLSFTFQGSKVYLPLVIKNY